MPPFRRVGRPGLLGTVARTAVIAGTATATSNAVSRRGAQRSAEKQAYAEQQYEAEQAQQQAAAQQYAAQQYAAQQAAAQQAAAQQYAAPQPAAPAGGGSDLMTQLNELAQLHTAGVLSDAEFTAAKAKLLG